MTYKLDWLKNVKRIMESKVYLPNGKFSFVTHTGGYRFHNGFTVKNVSHIPDFKYNFLSFSKITKDMECSLIFYPKFAVS